MCVVLCKAADTHQTMKLTGFLMAVNQSQLAHTKRQITVRTWFRLVYKDTTWTVHRFDREIFFIDHCCVHIFFIMIPMSGCLPEMSAQHDRSCDLYISRFVMDLSPIIEKCIFQYHTFREEERESRSLVPHHKQTKFFSESSVVTLLCLFQHCEVFIQFGFFRKCGSVNTLQHFILLASAPICACKTCQFKCFYRFCCHQMRSCTEIGKFSLRIEADHCIFRQILDQLYLIWFFFFLKICDCFRTRFCKLLDRKRLFYDFFHFCFDLFQILLCQRSLTVNIIIKSICYGWSDRKFCVRIQTLDRLRHNM